MNRVKIREIVEIPYTHARAGGVLLEYRGVAWR